MNKRIGLLERIGDHARARRYRRTGPGRPLSEVELQAMRQWLDAKKQRDAEDPGKTHGKA